MILDEARNGALELVARLPDAAIDLFAASLHIAADEYPQLPVGDYLARVEEWAGVLRGQHLHTASPDRAARAISHLLFDREGFFGNIERYYDPRNSYLNDVINSRAGIPVTLGILFLSVARRLGIIASGVGLPGHFICRVDSGGKWVLVDCFHGGAMLKIGDCRSLVWHMTGGSLRFQPRMLRRCSNRQVLVRLLNNLKELYLTIGDKRRACRSLQRMTLLDPRRADCWRELGVMLFEMGKPVASAEALQRYLELAPLASDASLVRAGLSRLQCWNAQHN